MRAVVVSCEHAARAVPSDCRATFVAHARQLTSHRGWDRGALELAEELAEALDAPLHVGRWSRLVVDLNRPETDDEVFSSISRALPAAHREALLQRVHRPYWRAVERDVARRLARGVTVVHVSVHTFTPVFAGRRRDVDVGLLLDPARPNEAALARRLQASLSERLPRLRARVNEPYDGRAPGLTTALRARHSAGRYAGLELEVNQRFVRAGPGRWAALRADLVDAVTAAVRAARAA